MINKDTHELIDTLAGVNKDTHELIDTLADPR